MPEVNTGFEQLLHCESWLLASFVDCIRVIDAGARTNTGWFALIIALMCVPFGEFLLALGIAKWLRNRAISSSAAARD